MICEVKQNITSTFQKEFIDILFVCVNVHFNVLGRFTLKNFANNLLFRTQATGALNLHNYWTLGSIIINFSTELKIFPQRIKKSKKTFSSLYPSFLGIKFGRLHTSN